MKTLSQLVPREWHTGLTEENLALSVLGVTGDSRQIKPGWIFVATRGESQDGHRFIGAAVQAGAVLVVSEEVPLRPDFLHLQVAEGRRALAWLAAAFYDHPSRSLLMVGVTGTSGKTTTSYLMESVLRAAGHEVGLLGTIQFRYRDQIFDSTHTTPGAAELQKLLAQMRDAGCTAVIMEVSSHALKQHRAAYVAFDAMIFTNLSAEHLDFHLNMEDYFQAKAMLFTEFAQEAARMGKAPVASIGVDTAWGERLVAELAGEIKRVVTFSADAHKVPQAELSTLKMRVDLNGISGEAGGVPIQSPLVGRFNMANILGAVGAALALGFNTRQIAEGISSVRAIPGRLEEIANAQGIHVLVDYAHKPDALEKVLCTLSEVKGPHRLITVFGCGGDRDRLKRPVMGKIAAQYSDWVIVTSDNPRTENPTVIIEAIVEGMQGCGHYNVEPDRKKAIYLAMDRAQAGDIVLIAGKGHENYQIVGSQRAPFDDRDVARAALNT